MPAPAAFPIDFFEAERDFNDMREVMAALSPEEVRTPNVDVTTAAIMGLVAAQKLQPMRAELAGLTRFDIRTLDGLPKYARGSWFIAQTTLPTIATADELRELETRGTALRQRFRAFAVPLVATGVFDAPIIDALNAGTGSKDLANDLVQYAVLYRSKWLQVIEQIKGITEAETYEAGNIGSRMLAATAARELSRDSASARTELRNRAWTVYDNAYAKCRRAVEYLLDGKGDVNQFVPTLRQQSSVRYAGERGESGESAGPVVQPVVQPGGGQGGAPVAGAPVAGAGRPIGDGGDPFKR